MTRNYWRSDLIAQKQREGLAGPHGEVLATCETHGARYMAHHADGSATCGRCYMHRAVELGVISAK